MKKDLTRIIALILAFLMVAAMFTACGKNDGKEEDKTADVSGNKDDENENGGSAATLAPSDDPGTEKTPEPDITPEPYTGRTLSGTYYLVGIEDGTVRDYLFNVLCEGDEYRFSVLLGVIGLTEDDLSTMEYFEFNPDGTGTRYEAHSGGPQAENFTWTQEGNTVSWIGYSGKPHTLTVTDADHFSYVFEGTNLYTRHFSR